MSKALPPMSHEDVELMVTQWRSYAEQWMATDRTRAERYQRLAGQMTQMLADGQCSLLPPTTYPDMPGGQNLDMGPKRRRRRE